MPSPPPTSYHPTTPHGDTSKSHGWFLEPHRSSGRAARLQHPPLGCFSTNTNTIPFFSFLSLYMVHFTCNVDEGMRKKRFIVRYGFKMDWMSGKRMCYGIHYHSEHAVATRVGHICKSIYVPFCQAPCTIAFVLVLHFIPHVHPFCVAEQSRAKTPPPHLISTIITYTGPCRFQDDPLLVRIPCSPQEGELVTVSAACASDWEYDKNRPCGPLGIFSKGRNVFNSFFSKIEFSLIETQLFVLTGLTTLICSRGGGLHFCVYNPKYI